jgi:hypothetical protein
VLLFVAVWKVAFVFMDGWRRGGARAPALVLGRSRFVLSAWRVKQSRARAHRELTMKSVALKTLLATLLALAALAHAGCSSYSASVKPGATLSKYRRVWVKSNMDDNHGIGQFISDALRARGIESGVGPLTMMPVAMQAVITYRDNWTWDFKDHMNSLEISMQDNKIDFPIATARYDGPTSLISTPNEVVDKLVAKLLAAPPGKKAE